MIIENSFDVAADPDRVFAFLRNPHNVAPCFPGAELTEDLGDDRYRGKVKIKLGPVTAAFSGTARITEKDEATRTAVLVAEGKDARGSGTAKATATMRVEPTETGSNVLLKTDLTISGKLAQFGRGIMADVSTRMVNDLAVRVRERIEAEPENTETTAAEPAAAEATAPEVAAPEVAAPEAKSAEAAPEETPAAADGEPETVAEPPAETAAAANGPETATGTPTESAAAPVDEAETPAGAKSKSETVAEAPAEAPAETTAASGGTPEPAVGADSGVVSGATTETATASATAEPPATAEPAGTAAPAAKATPAASPEPADAIKATTLLKVMITGVFRRLVARLRGRDHSA